MNKVEKLKKEAREHYKNYHDAIKEFDCGTDLAEYISSTARLYKRLFNETVDKLAKEDKNFPSGRRKKYYL